MTLHTPVPAGNERYPAKLAAELLSGPAAAIGLTPEMLMDTGHGPDRNRPPEFDLTAFGLRHAAASNAVSRMHGETANRTWGAALGHPIASVTNGVHVPTWQGAAIRSALDDRPPADLDDDDLWAAHVTQKHELMEFLGGRLTRQAVRHGVPSEAVGDLAGALDPEALTIGFARRFATYKRADLVLADPHRLGKLLADPDRPVQLIFAGKAHPADHPGQALLERVVAASRRVGTAGHVFFIEDYDLRVARFLVAGVDLWLNTPRRPLEASGTSGMKAALNGVPSLSVLDGWWDEGFDGTNGWAIAGTDDNDPPTADALYQALETDVIPAFFDRDAERRPGRWIEFMRRAMTVALDHYTAERALAEYVDRLYRPVARGAAGAEGVIAGTG
jgi:starch phosphorylase